MARSVVHRDARGESSRTIAKALDASRSSVRHILATYREAREAVDGGYADEEQRALFGKFSAAPGPRPASSVAGWRPPSADWSPVPDDPLRNALGELIVERAKTDAMVDAGWRYRSGTWHDSSGSPTDAAGQPWGNDFRAIPFKF
ncbi:hypothetical protein [Mycobacterium interjectum]|uniref:hypothetical protein n=1 Tax=Mycobacterium interjectum TaxID=33895 RepID=UPI00115578B1|nr:hypothetical protein [Mycobacterium interjectum]MCV7092032.1 hypothetical protein [Mycobacterium interjectum]